MASGTQSGTSATTTSSASSGQGGTTPQAVPAGTGVSNQSTGTPTPTSGAGAPSSQPEGTVSDPTQDKDNPTYGDPSTILAIGGQPNALRPFNVVSPKPAPDVNEQKEKDHEYFNDLFKVIKKDVVNPESDEFKELTSGVAKKLTDLGEIEADTAAKLNVADFDTLFTTEEKEEEKLVKVWDDEKKLYVDKLEKTGVKYQISKYGLNLTDKAARSVEECIYTAELKPLFTKNIVVIFGASGYTTNEIYKGLRPGSMVILPLILVKLLLQDECDLYTFDTDNNPQRLAIDYTTKTEGVITTETEFLKKVEKAKTPIADEKTAKLKVITDDLDAAKEEYKEDNLPKDVNERRDYLTKLRKRVNAIQHLIWNFIHEYGDEKLNPELTPVIEKYDTTVKEVYDVFAGAKK